MNPALQSWLDGGSFFAWRGHQIFYRRAGSGAPLLAIHGYPFSSWDWQPLWSALCAQHDVIAIDMLGFGFSDKPLDHAYSVREQATLCEDLLRHLGIQRADVLAHDMGNSVAQELLARHEQGAAAFDLRSLCFLNGGLFAETYTPRPVQRLLSSRLGKWVGPRIPRRAFDRSVSELFGPNTKPTREALDGFWMLLNYKRGMDVTHLVGRFILERVVHRDAWVQPMQRTRVPMCFINGPFDPNSGLHMAKRYQELIPRPDVRLLGDSIGHWPQWEAPGDTAQQVLSFLAHAGASLHTDTHTRS